MPSNNYVHILPVAGFLCPHCSEKCVAEVEERDQKKRLRCSKHTMHLGAFERKHERWGVKSSPQDDVDTSTTARKSIY